MLEILTIQMYVYDIYMYGYLCFKGCIVSILTSEKENIISIYIKVKFQDFLSVMSLKSHLLSLLILFIITIIFFFVMMIQSNLSGMRFSNSPSSVSPNIPTTCNKTCPTRCHVWCQERYTCLWSYSWYFEFTNDLCYYQLGSRGFQPKELTSGRSSLVIMI